MPLPASSYLPCPLQKRNPEVLLPKLLLASSSRPKQCTSLVIHLLRKEAFGADRTPPALTPKQPAPLAPWRRLRGELNSCSVAIDTGLRLGGKAVRDSPLTEILDHVSVITGSDTIDGAIKPRGSQHHVDGVGLLNCHRWTWDPDSTFQSVSSPVPNLPSSLCSKSDLLCWTSQRICQP